MLLALRGAAAGREIVLEEGIGAVRCVLEASAGAAGRVRFAIPQLPTEVGAAPDNATIAAALGIAAAEIGFDVFLALVGRQPFTFVPLGDLAVMARCNPDRPDFRAAFGTGGAYLFCHRRSSRARVSRPHVRARHGRPGGSATGSAAAAFVGVLGLHVEALALTIEQGYEMAGRA